MWFGFVKEGLESGSRGCLYYVFCAAQHTFFFELSYITIYRRYFRERGCSILESQSPQESSEAILFKACGFS